MHLRKSLILIFLLACPISVGSTGSDMVVEAVDRGCINWSLGYIEATGVGSFLKEDGLKPPPFELLLQQARSEAAKHIFETVRRIRIDAITTVGDFLERDPPYRVKIEEMVAAAKTVNQRTLSDGSVEITMRMPLYGGFAQFVLPSEIKQVESVRRLTPEENVISAESAADAGIPLPKEVAFTGLVVDAKGLGVVPVMSPVVYDEGGKEVFGPAFISREYAVHYGVCGYGKAVTAAIEHERVADNPLLVRGLRIKGPGISDIVISNADALKLRSASDNLSFLKKCRVMIVLD